MTEKELEALVKDAAATFGWLRYHTYDSRKSAAGFPDEVLVHPTKELLMFRELKTDIGRVTPDQMTWQNALVNCGPPSVEVWRPTHWH